MIKEKHEKGSDNVKEEPSSSDKDSPSSDVRVKKEEDGAGGTCPIKKEPGRPITKNGGLIGSTNTGSLQASSERKSETEETTVSENPLKTEEHLQPDIPAEPFLGLPAPQPPDGIQHLNSNVINKQTNMEPYMQQQSQIFVFSTMLANSGAEEVLQGRYPSMIAYHCAQPGTKKYLEKNPLKVTQFRPNPTQWLNNIAMMKSKGCTRSPLGPKNQPSIDSFLSPEGLDEMVALTEDLTWDQKNNHLDGLEGVSNGLPDVGPDMDACSPSLTNVPSLQGVKVPDADLTPQQRQHREEQLAAIRRMEQMLFPERQSMDDQAMSNVSNQESSSNNPTLDRQMNQPPTSMPGTVQQSVPSQMEWQKLQNQFYDDRKIKPPDNRGLCNNQVVPVGPVSSGPPSCSGPPSGGNPPRGGQPAGQRLQGPPPPYHQTQRSASVPIALQSPSPASPNNPTSNLSLPSPRASSALNSPADPNRPFGLTRHMSTGQSPTSQDSPSAPRLNHSNPGTPVSSHLSPSISSSAAEPCSTHQSSVDGMFGRTLQSMAQQKQQMSTSTTSCSTTSSSAIKEPNLMPVPSPQQIQYLNTFEGQELIIQKQPNTSLKEGNIISPSVLPTTMDGGFPGSSTDLPHSRVSGPNTPTSIDVGPRFPPTPSDGCRFQIPSPHTPTAAATTAGGDKSQRLTAPPGPTSGPGGGLSPQTVPGPTSDPLKNDLFPTPSPHMMDVTRFPPGPNASPGTKIGPGPGGGGFNVNVSPSGGGGKPGPMDLPNYGCGGGRGDNIPLNPNCTSSMSGNPKVSHFDPISSLAQMSQQLTNTVAGSLNGQGGQGPGGMMNFGSPSMHHNMMEMGSCHGVMPPEMVDQGGGVMMGMHHMQGPPHSHAFHPNSPMGGPAIRSLSPKLPGAFPNHNMPMPRMMGRPPGPPNPYNGANVQVKPNAPNTIQYLPAKTQVVGGQNAGPRGPPSLDFLQRFANPGNMDKILPGAQNVHHYFPGGGGPNSCGGPMPPHNMGGHNMDGGPMPPDMVGGPMMGGPPMVGNGNPMMGLGGGNNMGMMPMMRGPMPMRPSSGMMRIPPQMGFGVVGPPGHDGGMFGHPSQGGNMVGNHPNPQMFVGGPKGSPMGIGAPDASQPLPPSMGQNNSFKSSPFAGPTTADPTYAVQYHNFQQQLYATGTRNQMGGQTMGPGPPHPQQPPYFNPK